MAQETKGPQVVLIEACYAALGAGDAAVACVRKLSDELPDRIRAAREQLPGAFAKLADRGRRLTGQVATRNGGETAEPAEPHAAAPSTEDAERPE